NVARSGSSLVVEVLLFLFPDDLVVLEVRSDHLVVGDLGDRLLFLDFERLGGLGLAAAPCGGADGWRVGGGGVLLVGSALRAGGLGFAQVVELGSAVETV